MFPLVQSGNEVTAFTVAGLVFLRKKLQHGAEEW
jgi:hypothetical protein